MKSEAYFDFNLTFHSRREDQWIVAPSPVTSDQSAESATEQGKVNSRIRMQQCHKIPDKTAQHIEASWIALHHMGPMTSGEPNSVGTEAGLVCVLKDVLSDVLLS